MQQSVRWLVVLALIATPVVLAGPTLAQNAQQLSPSGAAQSVCQDTMRDVDRIACLVSAAPGPAPAEQRPSPPLLRGPDGKAIIGPEIPR
jgi:hypothetical protein